jgi:hypothetical protein
MLGSGMLTIFQYYASIATTNNNSLGCNFSIEVEFYFITCESYI